MSEVHNSFCNWIRILFLIRIWFSRGSSSPICSVTGSAIPITLWRAICKINYLGIHLLSLSKWWWRTPCDRYRKTSSTVSWRWGARGKPHSNEERNSNPITETVTCGIWCDFTPQRLIWYIPLNKLQLLKKCPFQARELSCWTTLTYKATYQRSLYHKVACERYSTP